jgi:nucleolar protein 56
MGRQDYVLFESASGYALFEVVESDKIGALLDAVQQSVTDAQRFKEIVKMTAFQPFKSTEDALENVMNCSEGIMHDSLKTFLEMNLPQVKKLKKAKYSLGVLSPAMGTAIQDGATVPCHSDEAVREIIRGIRLHFTKYIKVLGGGKFEQAQLGLGHSYSRAKVKFNVNRSDNMIIQAICLLDQMDKDINKFAMRVREWYGWHFPEMVKVVADNHMYAKMVVLIGDRAKLNEERLAEITAITMDEEVSKKVVTLAKTSMGMDVAPVDLTNIVAFAQKLVGLQNYRAKLFGYLQDKMAVVAPNLGELVGEIVAARLISHAGSLTNLAKCPASTVQILGAEKALFRALKTRGNTPKYGLIFHSSFISRAGQKNKGRISRYLANKCAIAARIDSFSEIITNKYGLKMKEQVEERLRFYAEGVAPRKNIDCMRQVGKELEKEAAAAKAADGTADDKKRKREASSDSDDSPKKAKKAKKEKKEKKSKKDKKAKKAKKSKKA